MISVFVICCPVSTIKVYFVIQDLELTASLNCRTDIFSSNFAKPRKTDLLMTGLKAFFLPFTVIFSDTF